MRFVHRDHPGRGLRLAYCLNLHPAEDLEGVLDGMRSITLPLAERLEDARAPGARFGVGLWLSGPLALELGAPMGRHERARLVAFLRDHGLDPFTFNAFPYGGFHREGLKSAVFRPTWKAPERLAYTIAVADVALAARAAIASQGGGPASDHVSISTHAGMFGADVAGEADLNAIAENLAIATLHLARIEQDGGARIVLAVEPEPRSSANDTRELVPLLERVRAKYAEVLMAEVGVKKRRMRPPRFLRFLADLAVEGHLGACLDACHAAVEFEDEVEALERATSAGAPLGKLQFSSALALRDPAADDAGRAQLLAMAEPVYLHQVTGRRGDDFVRATDLPEVAAAWEAGDERWAACDEWRCHFHVPVDLGDLASDGEGDSRGAGAAPVRSERPGGLTTTRPQADRLLEVALSRPERWGTDELHVEIETYTWDVLPGAARGPGDLVDGLEREYRHVLARLAAHGWEPAPAPPETPRSR